MNKRLAVSSSAAVLVLLVACGAKVPQHAVGTYRLDKGALTKIEATGMDVTKAAEITRSIDSTIELKADGTSAMQMKVPPLQIDQTSNGTWRLDGDKLSLTAKGPDGKDITQVADYTNGSFTLRSEGVVQMQLTYRKQ